MIANNIREYGRMLKIMGLFLVLFIYSGMAIASAEEVVGTILFEPQKTSLGYQYILDTTGNRVADKTLHLAYGSVGIAMDILPHYLVAGAKIVYENRGMQNRVGEQVHPNRILAIIIEDGTRIELYELVSGYDLGYYFRYLIEKLERENRLDIIR